MQPPCEWHGNTLLILALTSVVTASAYEGKRLFLDLHLQNYLQNQGQHQNHISYEQIPVTVSPMAMVATTTNVAQLVGAAQQVQAQSAMAAQNLAAEQRGIIEGAVLATTTQTPPAPTTAAPLPQTPPPTMPPAAAAAPGAVPGAVPAVAPPAIPAATPDAGITMPDVAAADLLPVTAETDPEAAEQMMAAAKSNAAPAGGPEAKVIADWAQRFGQYSVDATVKAMRDVVGQIAREKAEEVIQNVFNNKYPNLHAHGLLPPMPAPAPGPAPASMMAPAPPQPPR